MDYDWNSWQNGVHILLLVQNSNNKDLRIMFCKHCTVKLERIDKWFEFIRNDRICENEVTYCIIAYA